MGVSGTLDSPIRERRAVAGTSPLIEITLPLENDLAAAVALTQALQIDITRQYNRAVVAPPRPVPW